MENEFLRTVILLDKGSDIMELGYKPKNINMLLESPEGHRNPKRLTALSPYSHGIEDLFGGGWHECLPNAGSPCTVKGIPQMLHGEVPLSSFDCSIEEESRDVVRARLGLTLIRYPIRLTKWFELRKGESCLRIKEKLENLSDEELDYSWLHHPNFGPPFLEPGCKIEIKGGNVIRPNDTMETNWPYARMDNGKDFDISIIPNKDLKLSNLFFISNLLEPWYSLYNPNIRLGIAIRWDADIFHYMWFGRNMWSAGYPWYGRLWNIGLEFSTSIGFGLEDQIKNGTAAKLKGGSTIDSHIIATIYEKNEEVKEFDKEE
jgi:hypothetical protein